MARAWDFATGVGCYAKGWIWGVSVSVVVVGVYITWRERKCWSVVRGVLQNWGVRLFVGKELATDETQRGLRPQPKGMMGDDSGW